MQRSVLAIGPANYAGQAHEWAAAVNRQGQAAAWSFSFEPLGPGSFQFPADKMMGRYSYRNPLLRGARARWFFRDTTHVALDGFDPFYHLKMRGKLPGDVRQLQRAGKRVALIAHGSDVRSPDAHAARHEWSYFAEGSPEWRKALSTNSAEARRYAQESGLPVFYSTPDLGFDLPFGTWLPVCVDVAGWRTDEPLLERHVPRVLHIPSRRTPPIKGSQYIEPVLEDLARAGVIEHVAPESVPHREMKALVQSCDVVIDQILIGSYGVAAVEAMAAGRVLIGSLDETVASLMPERPEMLVATPDTLRDTVLRAVEDRVTMREQAERNRRFVERWHDGTESARRLGAFLGLSAEDGDRPAAGR